MKKQNIRKFMNGYLIDELGYYKKLVGFSRWSWGGLKISAFFTKGPRARGETWGYNPKGVFMPENVKSKR